MNPVGLKITERFYKVWNFLEPPLCEIATGAMGSCCLEYLPCYLLHLPQLLSYWQFPSQAGADYSDHPSWLLLLAALRETSLMINIFHSAQCSGCFSSLLY